MPSKNLHRVLLPISLLLLASSCARYDVDFEPRYLTPKARVYFDIRTDKKDEVDLFQNGEITPTIDFVNVFWSIQKSTGTKIDAASTRYKNLKKKIEDSALDSDTKTKLMGEIMDDLKTETTRLLDEEWGKSPPRIQTNLRLMNDMSAARINAINASGISDQEKKDKITKVEALRDSQLAEIKKARSKEESDTTPRPRFRTGPSIGLGITTPAKDSEDNTEETDAPSVIVTLGWEVQFPFTLISLPVSTVGVELGIAQGWSSSESLDDVNDTAIYVGVNLYF